MHLKMGLYDHLLMLKVLMWDPPPLAPSLWSLVGQHWPWGSAMCFYLPHVKPTVVEELLITDSVWLSSLSISRLLGGGPVKTLLDFFHGAERSHGSAEKMPQEINRFLMINSLCLSGGVRLSSGGVDPITLRVWGWQVWLGGVCRLRSRVRADRERASCSPGQWALQDSSGRSPGKDLQGLSSKNMVDFQNGPQTILGRTSYS